MCVCVCGAKEGREREGGVFGSGCAWAPCCYPASQQAGHAFPGLRDFCCSTLHGITSPSQRAPSTPQTPTASCMCAQRHHRRLYFTNGSTRNTRAHAYSIHSISLITSVHVRIKRINDCTCTRQPKHGYTPLSHTHTATTRLRNTRQPNSWGLFSFDWRYFITLYFSCYPKTRLLNCPSLSLKPSSEITCIFRLTHTILNDQLFTKLRFFMAQLWHTHNEKMQKTTKLKKRAFSRMLRIIWLSPPSGISGTLRALGFLHLICQRS